MKIKLIKILDLIYKLIIAMFVFAVANAYTLSFFDHSVRLYIAVFLLVLFNIFPSIYHSFNRTKKLKQCGYGYSLLEIFLISATASSIYAIVMIYHKNREWLPNVMIAVLVNALVFWNGMIRVYYASGQLGIKWRVIGALCGMFPIVHLIVLGRIILITRTEAFFENDKIILNEKRASDKICETKYPVLMVHGVFFRDFRYFNYWGRVPTELEKNGAKIYYGNHQSALSVKDSAKEIDKRIREIVEETRCEKVNIIAHSKGGLDCRYALSELGTGEFTASLTTINTPHRGCEFADYLLSKIPDRQKDAVAVAYNSALKMLGDETPDFMAAVTDLTASACERRNEILKDAEGVLYQSIGSKLNHASGGRFPLNLSYKLVRYFDGKNDGLVGEKSFKWGGKYTFIETEGKRGISHGDMIDLNRENFKGFDVREFYVKLVSDLKNKGL